MPCAGATPARWRRWRRTPSVAAGDRHDRAVLDALAPERRGLRAHADRRLAVRNCGRGLAFRRNDSIAGRSTAKSFRPRCARKTPAEGDDSAATGGERSVESTRSKEDDSAARSERRVDPEVGDDSAATGGSAAWSRLHKEGTTTRSGSKGPAGEPTGPRSRAEWGSDLTMRAHLTERGERGARRPLPRGSGRASGSNKNGAMRMTFLGHVGFSVKPRGGRCCAIRGSRRRTSARGSRSRATTDSTRRGSRHLTTSISPISTATTSTRNGLLATSTTRPGALARLRRSLLERELRAIGFEHFVRTRHGEPVDLDGPP
jgi:hypothetical protein